jgi:hypothetical protein
MFSRARAAVSISFALATAGLLATSCFQDSCACVTVPPTREDHWIGLTPSHDSVELTLTSVIGSAGSIGGTGVIRPQSGPTRSLSILGATDDGIGSPSQLTITGWFAAPVNWIQTGVRADSLYGIVFLPAGITLGDTLALFLRRRQ